MTWKSQSECFISVQHSYATLKYVHDTCSIFTLLWYTMHSDWSKLVSRHVATCNRCMLFQSWALTYITLTFFKWAILGLIFVFPTQLTGNLNLPMTGFKLWIFGIRSNCSTSWATASFSDICLWHRFLPLPKPLGIPLNPSQGTSMWPHQLVVSNQIWSRYGRSYQHCTFTNYL